MKDARNTWFEFITNPDNSSWDTEHRPSRRPARPGTCRQEYDNTLQKYRRHGPSTSQRHRAEDELKREVLDSLDDNMEWVTPAALAIKEFADEDWTFWRDGWSDGMRSISSALKAASSLTGSEQLVWAAFRMAEHIIVDADDEIWPRIYDGEGIHGFEKCIETMVISIQYEYDAWFCADLSKDICRLLLTDDDFRHIFDGIAAILGKSADNLQAEAGWKSILLMTAAFACYSGWRFANSEYIWCDEGPFSREGDVLVYDARGALARMGFHQEYDAQTLVAYGLMELGMNRDTSFRLARERGVREASVRVEMSDPIDAFLCLLGITSITHVSEISGALFYSRPFWDVPGIEPECYALECIEHSLMEDYKCWLHPEDCQDEEPPL